jgi:hypothetical protein
MSSASQSVAAYADLPARMQLSGELLGKVQRLQFARRDLLEPSDDDSPISCRFGSSRFLHGPER